MKETKEEKAHRIANMLYEESMEDLGLKDYPPLDPGQHTFMGEEEDLNKYNVEGYDHFENPCGHLNPPEAFGPGGPLTDPT